MSLRFKKKRSSSFAMTSSVKVAVSGAAQVLSSSFFIAAALVFLLIGQVRPTATEGLRLAFIDVVSPVLTVAATPVHLTNQAVQTVTDVINVFEENKALRAENARLREWHHLAMTLEQENQALRTLVDAVPERPVTAVTTRVVAESNAPFLKNVLIPAGQTEGIAKGQAAVAASGRSFGLAGRVVNAGQTAARVLLLTDINSRIPVKVRRTGDRAILAGQNNAPLQLAFLPQDAVVQNGDFVVTSGDGGLLPADIPVGVIARDNDSVIVRPLADLDRLEHLRVLVSDSLTVE